MRRLGNIYGAFCNYGNLAFAFGKVQRGKRWRSDMVEWSCHLEDRLNGLLEDLERGDFRFGDYTVFQVHDPKERTIYAASIRERVIHHAVINVCGWWLENGLIDDCYACRAGKGQLKAVERAQQFAVRHPWCLKLDIKSYFDSIDQEILFGILNRRIKDRRMLGLFMALLSSYSTQPGKGIPIGNLTSQYFANLYLDVFDRWAAQRSCRGYVRYMDDMLIFGQHEDLRCLKEDAGTFLHEKLALRIKCGGSLQPVTRGVDFLGYRVFPGYRLLNHRSKQRFVKKNRILDELFSEGMLSEAAYQSRLTSLLAFVNHANAYKWRYRVCQTSVE